MKFLYIFITGLSILTAAFCLGGVIYCTIYYHICSCNNSYLNIAAAFSVGLLAALIQFVFLIKSNIESKRNKIKYTSEYISANREKLLPLYTMIPELSKVELTKFKFKFNNKTNFYKFKNSKINLTDFIISYKNAIVSSYTLLGSYIGNYNVATYNKSSKKTRVKKFGMDLDIIDKIFSTLNKVCNLMDSLFENYYNDLFDKEMIDSYIETVIYDVLNRVVYFVLLIRKRDLSTHKTLNGSDWRFLYRYIKENVVKR